VLCRSGLRDEIVDHQVGQGAETYRLLAAPASTRVRVDEGDRGAGLAYLEGEALLQIEPDGVGGVAAVADREVLAAHEVEVAPPLADDDGAVDGPGPPDGTAEH